MGLVINTNVSALTTASALNKSGDSLKTSMERLSTGKEINSAADNAAGKAISTNMTRQIDSLEQGINNAKDGINLLATVDGAASEIENMTLRMHELSVQAQNGTYNATDLGLLNKEYTQLGAEIDRVAENTEFNGIKLIAGTPTSATVDIKTGEAAADKLVVTAVDMTADTLLGAAIGDITSSANAATEQGKLKTALTAITGARTTFGAQTNRLDFSVAALEVTSTNTAAARSQIEDADFAKETTNLARAKVLQNAGIAMLQQANSQTSNVEQLLR